MKRWIDGMKHIGSDEEEKQKLRKFLINFSLFLIPFILAVCIVELLIYGSLYALFALFALVIPAYILWVAHSRGYKIF